MAVELPEECRSAVEELIKLVYITLVNRSRARRATKYITDAVKSLQGVAQAPNRLLDNIGRVSDMWADAVTQELVTMRSLAITMESTIVLCLERGARLEDVLIRMDTILDIVEEAEREAEKKREAEAQA